MRRTDLSAAGRIATWLATWFAPPYKGRYSLALQNRRGYIAPSATIYHNDLRMGEHVFIGDRVVIFQHQQGGAVELGDGVRVNNDCIIEVGQGGSLIIAPNTVIQPRCQFSVYKAAVRIGFGVQIAPNCAFYPYDHGMAPGQPISQQPLQSRGDIVLGNDVWLGYGVVVLAGVHIGAGAVIGANAVVTRDIPAGAIAVGSPARVVRMRSDLVKDGAAPVSEAIASISEREG